MVTTNLSFRTINETTTSPLTPTETLDFSGPGAPAGWTSVGTAGNPTFTGVMTPDPGNGTSYIEKSAFGLEATYRIR